MQAAESFFEADSGTENVGSQLRLFWEHLRDHIIPHPRNHYHPHLLHHRSVALFSLLLITVKVVTVSLVLNIPDSAFSSAITAENIYQLTNQSRAGFNLASLRYNNSLAQAAEAKAQALLACSCFQHTLPDGTTPWDFIKRAGYSYMSAGENLAVDFTEAENVEDAWMNSPGHKANILNKNFEEIGIGVSQGTFEGHTAIFVVQEFGTPADQPIVMQNQPTVVAPAPTATVPAPSFAQATESVPPAPVPTQPHISIFQPQTAQASPAPIAVLPKIPQTPLGLPLAQPVASVPAPVLPEELKILSHDMHVSDGAVHLTVATSSVVANTLAYFGSRAAWVSPKSDTSWDVSVPLSEIGNNALSVQVKDIFGNRVTEQVANFSNSVSENYGFLASKVAGESITVFGKNIQPTVAEHKFYLIFIALILTCLVIAIAVHRHIQHVSLVANSAFVVSLAMLLWLG